MKRILITGKKSYVGNSLEEWLSQYPDQYQVDKISLRTEDWKQVNFSVYDSIVHVAGIAHVSTDPKMEELYYRVNRDLTIEVARKAKEEKVKQFIFMSSIIVYGKESTKNGLIQKNTVPIPDNFYGKSKLEAEKKLIKLKNEDFKIAIIRPPMIYGKNSKGNYPKLSKLARFTPIFPDFPNKRSMIHIDNLSEFLRLIIDNEENGLYFPQNKEYVKTSEMVKLISQLHGKKVYLTKLFNFVISFLKNRVGIIDKVFGTLIYEQSMSEYVTDYNVNDLRETIKLTERN